MAIVKLGPPVAGLRGTIGGVTFSENKAGPYAKLWSGPSNARTERQMVERGYMGRMPGLWKGITGLQKIGWAVFAALLAQRLTNSLGEFYFISGYGWFCKCNIRLLRVGRATIAAVPTQARPAAPTLDDFRVCVAGGESDLCTCGVASASTQHAVHPPADAFDDNLGTFWTTLTGNDTGWLEYDFCDPVNVKRYRLYPHVADYTECPKDWTFEVFTGGGWEVIHTVTGHTPGAAEWADFYCANPYTETDYRINVSANNGDVNHLTIDEMEMYLGDVGSSVVCYPEDEFDDAPDWDPVLFVSMGNSVGMLVQYVGFYEVLALQGAGRWYELFQEEIESVFGSILENRVWFCRLARQTTEGLRSSWTAKRSVTLS